MDSSLSFPKSASLPIPVTQARSASLSLRAAPGAPREGRYSVHSSSGGVDGSGGSSH
jgi:hypothetical protein